jgi:hypothetical protein
MAFSTGLHEKRRFRLPPKSTTWKVVNFAEPSVARSNRLLKSNFNSLLTDARAALAMR